MTDRVRIPVASIPWTGDNELLVPAAGCNCQVCPFWIGDGDHPGGTEPVCSGKNTSCDYCACARPGADACGSCSIRCGSRVDIRSWMADVGGTLLFDDIPPPAPLPSLPRFVPQVDGDTMDEFRSGIDWPAWAVGLRRMFSKDSHTIQPRWHDTTAREFLGLRDDQLTVLVGYGEDPLVEAWWTRRKSDDLLNRFAAQQWDVILAPNLSCYGNQPRAEMLLNYRRCHLAAAELQEACGDRTAVAPNVYWWRAEDVARHADWIEDNDPSVIAMNLQTYRWDTWWEEIIHPGVLYLGLRMQNAGVRTKVIVTGTTRPNRMRHLLEAFGDRLILVSQNAMQLGRRGATMTDTGRQDLGIRPGDAFGENVRYYDGLIQGRAFELAAEDGDEDDADE